MTIKYVSLITGGFDPLHSGHIKYINAAKSYGDILVVGLNSDKWLENKKGKFFLPFNVMFYTSRMVYVLSISSLCFLRSSI